MKVIGITGGVGAGKSTVLSYMQEHIGACIIEADKVGHLVMEPGQICYDQVIALFGEQIIKKDKTIDRKMISDIVFANEIFLEKLNEIIHPAVRNYIINKIQQQQENGCPIVVVEAALLLEDHYDEFCDRIWYVHTEKEIRISRLMKNRGYSREKSESIIASQASEAFFMSHADYVIKNNDDLKNTWQQIEEGIRQL